VACPTGSELTTIPQHMLSYRKENALPKNKPGMGSRFRGNGVLTVAMLFSYQSTRKMCTCSIDSAL
jgi:hypothetical protein